MRLPAGIARKLSLAAVVFFWLTGDTPLGWAEGSSASFSRPEQGPPLPLDDRPAEKPVRVPPAAAPAPVATSVPAEVLALDSNMAARVNDVLACRLQIATDRRVRLDQVAAGTILVRWTIQPGGGVADAEVVAEKKTDPDVLSCARRKMESWVFIRAPGGEPMHLQQSLKFD